MQTDEEIFRFHTLALDRDRGLQFFRWKENIKKKISPIFASPGEILHGITRDFTQYNQELLPSYPVENVSSETADHIHSVQRLCSMPDSFVSSETFSLRLLENITPITGRGLFRTYKYHIHSIGVGMKDVSASRFEFLCSLLVNTT